MPDGKMGGGYGPIDSPKADENKDGTYSPKSTGGVK
jgi:hypothetical protein